MPRLGLCFACELETNALDRLFTNPAVMDHLWALEASVALGIIDLSPGRAEVVRRLNEAEIPLIAWQLLPKEEGYWYNVDNAPQAAARYQAFKAWTAEYDLKWAGLGIDIEPDLAELQQLLSGARWRLLPGLLSRAVNGRRVQRAQAAYGALVGQMQADGYPVQSYHFPFIVDERQAGSTLLQRLFGILEVPTDEEILMLYTSFVPEFGPGLLWSYAPDAQCIAVGVTGGGVDLERETPTLTWEEFARDLLLARQWKDDVFVFSLEGCVERGFMERLLQFDWDQPVKPPLRSAQKVTIARKAAQTILWASARPFVILGAVTATGMLVSRLRALKRQKGL